MKVKIRKLMSEDFIDADVHFIPRFGEQVICEFPHDDVPLTHMVRRVIYHIPKQGSDSAIKIEIVVE